MEEGKEGPRYKLTLKTPVPGVIEVVCEGYLDNTAAPSYLGDLEALVKKLGDVTILYNALAIDGYDLAWPTAHITPFRAWLGKLRKVAVAHKMASIGFAIATVSLATKVKIKGFSDRDEAIQWLQTP